MYMWEISSGCDNRGMIGENKQLLLITNNVSMYDSEVVCFLHVFRIFIYYKAKPNTFYIVCLQIKMIT